jgi:hypothetical protein
MKIEALCALSLLTLGCKSPGQNNAGDLASPTDDMVAAVADMMAPPGSDLRGADLRDPADLAGADLKLAGATAFTLVDVNPNSVPAGQMKGTATYAGKALAVIFLEAS